MKRSKILLTLLLLLIANIIYAAETEPNNTKAQADVLALNGNNSGAISVSGDEDWWKVTTNADGKLNVTINISNGINLYCYIYDNNGTTELSSGYSSTTKLVSADGLAAGTYYIKLRPYYAGQLPAYTISNQLVTPAQANDTEPNDSKAQAKVLPLNNSQTGHAGFYFNNKRDTADWYKITTNADGRLRITMVSANAQNIYVHLYDNNGTALLDQGYTSGTAAVVNADGLAAGTYYVKVRMYYTTGFAPYTISDSLFVPAQANDIEPNDSKALALTLPLNGSKTGHAGYFFNNKRDSADWYKVATNADGRLRITMSSANAQNVYVHLYDNNGTTLLDQGYTSGTTAVINADGLAAGTYYIKVRMYYTTGFAPYTISDSLFVPAQANDTEPNDSKEQAVTLPLNGSKTGHTGYFYNNKRDSADWYKIITTKDGSLRLTMASANAQNVYVHLYDNNGAILLDQGYTSGTAVVAHVDGLAAGTYYAKVRCYYNNGFAPYRLYDSLFAYNNENDEEPNKKPYEAKTVLSNKITEGHVGFYYNNSRDTVDWWKINYTGNNGNLSFTIKQEPLKLGGFNHLYFQVYKDTAAAPIHSSYGNVASRPVNLTGLTKGYYWIKIFPYYNYKFSSYSISNTFQQTKAKIVTQTYTDAPACSGRSITYKLTLSKPPYTVALFRFGKQYGAAKIVKTGKAVFNNLPAGIYYATVYGDGATGNAKGVSDTVTILPPAPGGLRTTAIQATQAKLNWTAVPCADYYVIQYKTKNAVNWTTKYTQGNTAFLTIKNLKASTIYNWTVAAVDTANGMSVKSSFGDTVTFKTKADAAMIADNDDDDNSENLSVAPGKLPIIGLTVAPNPASSFFTIRYNSNVKDKLTATLFNMNGKAVWTSGAINAEALNNRQVNVSQLAGGLYYLRIIDAKGNIAGDIKVAVTK